MSQLIHKNIISMESVEQMLGGVVGKLRLLVVDDTVLCRKFHIRMVKEHCSDVVEACNGQEAVDAVQLAIS